MYEIEVMYDNGVCEVIEDVCSWGSIQNGLLIQITTQGVRPSVLIPSDKIMRISRVDTKIARRSYEKDYRSVNRFE